MGNGSSTGGGIAGLGVVLIAVGVIAYLYPEEQATYWGLSSATIYPYREIGELLLIFGIITTVIGGVVAAVAASSNSPQLPVVIQYPTTPQRTTSKDETFEPKKRCVFCGRAIPVDSVVCAYCGEEVNR